MNICTFNQQQLSADGTRNTATTLSRQRCLQVKNDTTCDLHKPLLVDSGFIICEKRLGFEQQKVFNKGTFDFAYTNVA